MASKNDEMVEIPIDDELVTEFVESLEGSINKICKKTDKQDPRLELLVSLGVVACQVAMDCGFECSDFLELMEGLYKDYEEPEEVQEQEVDRKNIN